MTTEVIEQIKKIHNKGFTVALDDFVMHDEMIAYDALFKLVHIVKIDYLFTPPNERQRIERTLKQYPHLSLLAEKIETEAQYEQAKKDGYHLFQECFFAEREIVKGIDIPINQNWDSILPRLHFTDIINDTLIDKETPMTPYLKLSIAMERLDMGKIEYYALFYKWSRRR